MRSLASSDKLASNDGLQELQRFAELGRLSASLLHEISNPLTAALLHLELSGQDSHSIRQAQRDMRLMQRYVEAARQQVRQNGRATSFCVQPQLGQVKRIVVPIARGAGVRLEIKPAPNCTVYGDPIKFQHTITNLLVNAIEAYGEDCSRHQGALVKAMISASPGWLTIQVTDWGQGIAADMLPHIFDTFYTTKDRPGHGLGIGLAIVKEYATVDFGGSIKVSSSRRKGTQFTLKLRSLQQKGQVSL